MKALLPLMAGLMTMTAGNLEAKTTTPSGSVSPALAAHTEQRIDGDLWKRTGLSPRDRALVAIAALIARGESAGVGAYADKALEYGVKPAELSEAVLHLAYYTGWGNAMNAVAPITAVFERRGIGADQLPDVSPRLLPLDEAAEAARSTHVSAQFAAVAPGLVDYTTNYLFRDLWLRPDLAPRDRSMVTVAALMAMGQAEQIPFHLNKAMDNGLTATEAGEIVTTIAFYAGWPKAFSAAPVVAKVLEQRGG